MKQFIKKVSAASIGLTLALSGVVGISASAMSEHSSKNDPSRYIASLHPLNKSGVTGYANLTLNSEQPGANLVASVNARGTEANQIHAIHIHGMLDGGDAECPTFTADENNDKVVSVFEGAPFYGPIKVSFTDPVTQFGPPANTTLFAPFAGAPVFANFPHANSDGKVSYDKSIPFDMNNHYAVQALESLTPLSDQHIVVHGGYAPESVDTPGGDPNKIVYDPLLPIACGSIVQTHKGSMANNNQNHEQNDDNDKEDEGSNSHDGEKGSKSRDDTYESSHNSNMETNNNEIHVSNNVDQHSTTGSVTEKQNTSSHSAKSGDSTNKSDSSFIVNVMNRNYERS